MRLTDILSERRIVLDGHGSSSIQDKNAALLQLGQLIAAAVGLQSSTVFQLLVEREKLQSTGIGDGVAIPHASTDAVASQAAALLICPQGIDFCAIDGGKVRIVFGVVGPRRATGEHLKTLARIARLLRDGSTRNRLVGCEDPSQVFDLIKAQDATY